MIYSLAQACGYFSSHFCYICKDFTEVSGVTLVENWFGNVRPLDQKKFKSNSSTKSGL